MTEQISSIDSRRDILGGFHLLIKTKTGDYDFLVEDVEMARFILSEVNKLRVWIRDTHHG